MSTLFSNFTSKIRPSIVQTFFRNHYSFKSNQTVITKTKQPKDKPIGNLGFGQYFSDHMLIIQWNLKHGWNRPQILEFAPLTLSPAIKALHYATSAFEGLKAVKGVDGVCRLFRADKHLERMLSSAKRICLPEFDTSELLNCIKMLIKIDERWVPNGRGEALYVRPFIFGCDATLGVDISTDVMICTILSPVGSYFSTKQTAVSLYADSRFVRAFEGGCGAFKLSANYAPTLHVQQIVKQKGCQTSLWLYGPEELITEAGTMNIFIFWTNEQGEKELITPPLSGLILPGVTRDSVLEITKKWNEFQVTEKNITMPQLLKALREDRVNCIFGTGTACVVSPVGEIICKDARYKIPHSEEPTSLPERIRKAHSDIMLGVNGPHPWIQPID